MIHAFRIFLFHSVTMLIVLLTLAACSSTGRGTSDKYDLYLLIGQSNMAGRGHVEAVDKVPHERVFVFDKNRQWVAAVDPLHFDKPDRVGVGPGLSFGKAMARHDSKSTVGLIPAAVGGSAISAWTVDGYHAQTQSYPYNDAIARTRAALKDGVLKGILWHQGESDSAPEKALLYRAALLDLVARLRRDLDAPDVPFLVGGLGEFGNSDASERENITKILRSVSGHIAQSAFVSAHDLRDKGDKVHFSAAAARELGERYAARLIAFRQAR